jgi:branched-chain amino acid transport system permease protein
VLIIGGTGYLYGGIVGAVAFKVLQDIISTFTPQYWQFWIGLILVAIVLIGRDRMGVWAAAARAYVLNLLGLQRFTTGGAKS